MVVSSLQYVLKVLSHLTHKEGKVTGCNEIHPLHSKTVIINQHVKILHLKLICYFSDKKITQKDGFKSHANFIQNGMCIELTGQQTFTQSHDMDFDGEKLANKLDSILTILIFLWFWNST